MVLPKRFILAIIALSMLGGCGKIPRWSPTIKGRILDSRTSEPIPGIEVFTGYFYSDLYGPHYYEVRWATTDSQGRFSVPGHIRGPSPRWIASISRYPAVMVLHPDYGQFKFQFSIDDEEGHPKLEFPGHRNLEFSIEPSERSIEIVKDPSAYQRLCPSGEHEACVRACEVVYGTVEPCYVAGLARMVTPVVTAHE